METLFPIPNSGGFATQNHQGLTPMILIRWSYLGLQCNRCLMMSYLQRPKN